MVRLNPSARRFLALINSLPCLAWAVDRDLYYTMMEGGALAPLGLKPGDLVGRSLPDVFGTADPEHVAISHHTRALRGEELSYDFCYLGRCFRSFLSPDRDKHGSIRCVNGLAFDITRQNAAGEALQKSEEMLKTIVTTSRDCISMRDLTTGQYVFLSPSVRNLTGYSEEEMNRLGFEGFVARFHAEDREAYLRYASKVSRGEDVPGLIEYRWKTKTGNYRWFSDSQSLIRNSSGDPYALLRISRDITEQKTGEEVLRESERKFHMLADFTHDWEMWLGEDRQMIYCSPACERISGYLPQEFASDPGLFSRLLYPDDRVRFQEHWDAGWRDREPGEIDFRILHRDGSVRWIGHVCQPVTAPDGKPLGRRVSNRDITESKKAEKALRRVNHQLNLLSSITRHDIRNQLMALMSYIELARLAGPDTDKTPEFLRNAYDAALIIDSQIQFMKEYQDIGSRVPQWFALSELVNQIKIPDGILFSADVEGIELYADPLLGKVFYNLFDNSLRHGKRVTGIQVRTRKDEETLRVIWQDNGIGVAEAEKDTIFMRGYGKNTGLGLFLTREILGLTGLAIRENGLPDEGARFEIIAPKGCWRIALAAEKTPPVQKTELNPERVFSDPGRAGLP